MYKKLNRKLESKAVVYDASFQGTSELRRHREQYAKFKKDYDIL